MGLKSGPTGAKALFKTNFSDAFAETASLYELRERVGIERARTSVALDGNVLLMNCPNGLTFDAYCEYAVRCIHSAIAAASLVFVVFDEPEHSSGAKLEEQMRRDGQSTKRVVKHSADVPSCPTTDSFTMDEIGRVRCMREVIRHRAARTRVYDAVMVRAAEVIRASLHAYDGATTVLFDGVDRRGIDRPFGTPRVPEMVEVDGDSAAEDRFAHHSEGEGDLKLRLIAERVCELATGAEETERRLHVTCTVDTDSLAIELLREAQHARAKSANGTTPFVGVIAMRERGKKDGNGDAGPGYYTCCDTRMLYMMLRKHMWDRVPRAPATTAWAQSAISLLVGGLVLAGSDFVDLKGMRADLVLEAVPGVLCRSRRAAANLSSALLSGDAATTRHVVLILRDVVDAVADIVENTPRHRKAAVEAMRSVPQTTLLRAAWVCAYWSQHEFEDVGSWGFAVMRSNDI
jgi:hypothetical protein